MIPIIGIMVGAYIITRMINFIADREETGLLTTILAAITILISLYAIYALATSGIEMSDLIG